VRLAAEALRKTMRDMGMSAEQQREARTRLAGHLRAVA
jgi:hypothetical protein